jgi:hypothetical protein
MQDVLRVKATLSEELGISPDQIPGFLLAKIAEDELYLHHIMVCKDDKELLGLLLKEPAGKDVAKALPTDSEIVSKLSHSLYNWARLGFSKASLEEYKGRLESCNSCPYKVKPDGRMLYKLVKPNYICQLCGCDIERKAALQTESCPDKSYGKDGRWQTIGPVQNSRQRG